MASNVFDQFDQRDDQAPRASGARNVFDQFDAAPEVDPRRDRTWGEVVTDLGAAGMSGLVGLAKVPAMAIDRAVTGEWFGPGVQALTEYGDSINDQKSPALRQREREQQAKIAAAGKAGSEFVGGGEGVAPTAARIAAEFGVGAATSLSDPMLLPQFVTQQLPMLAASRRAGLVAGAVAQRGAAAVPGAAATPLGQAAVRGAATGGAVGAGATIQASDVGSDAYTRLLALPDEVWGMAPEFVALSRQIGPEAAKQRLASDKAFVASFQAAAASVLSSMLPGGAAIERAMVGKAAGTPGAPSAVASRVRPVGGAIVGEARQEGIEEGLGALAANEAVAAIDPTQDRAQGVGGAAGQGAALGAVMGGGMQALQASRSAPPAAANPFDAFSPAVPSEPALAPSPSPASAARPAPDDAAAASPRGTPTAQPDSASLDLSTPDAPDNTSPADMERLAQLEIIGAQRPFTEPERIELERLAGSSDAQSTAMPPAPAAAPEPDTAAPDTTAQPSSPDAEAPLFSTRLPDPSLQNRDRSRAASVAQMAEIARRPDYARLGISRSPESGAPMVFAVGDQLDAIEVDAMGHADVAVMADGQRVPFRYAVVDASQVQPSNFADGRANPGFKSEMPGTLKALNNGRTAGVRASHELGTAGPYLDGLRADAAAHGIPPAVIDRTPNAMLVRVYGEASNTANMAAKSQGQALGLSPAEQARSDAALIDSSVLAVLQSADIASPANRDAVRAFAGKAQAAGMDVAGLMTQAGTLSAAGRQRIQAALMQAAYSDGDLVAEMFESTSPDIKAIGEALKTVAGEWAAMRDAARQGAIASDADLTENLLQAVGLIRKSRNEQTSLHELLLQPDLLTGEAPDPLTAGMVRMFVSGKYLTRPLGRERVIGMLRDYIAAASATTNGDDLLGSGVTIDDVLQSIIARKENSDAQAGAEEGMVLPAGRPPGGRGAAEERVPDEGQPDGGGSRGAGPAGQPGLEAGVDTAGQGRARRRAGDGAAPPVERGQAAPLPAPPSGASVARQEAQVYRVNEPGSTTDVPLDLFPDTLEGLQLPADGRGLASQRPAGAGVRGDVQPEPGVPRGVVTPNVLAIREDPELPGLYHASTQLVEVGRRELPVAQVRSWRDAASALNALGRYAVEHLDVLVTDAAGKPLAVVGAFKGGIAHAPVDIPSLLQEALRIKGAARAWAVHNHPSGSAELSRADEQVARDAGRAFDPSTVQFMGLAAIGDGTFSAVNPDGQRFSGPLITGTTAASVPVVERTITRGNAGMPKVGSPDAARAVVAQASGGKPGILFVDVQNRLTAWVPVDPKQMRALRADGRFDRLVGAAAQAGARSAILANPGDVMTSRTLDNLASALELAGVRTLDVIDPTSGTSAASTGRLPSTSATVLSRALRRTAAVSFGGDGMRLADLVGVVSRVERKLPGLPPVRVLQSWQSLGTEGSQGRLREQIEAFGAGADVEGALHEGEIYLFAANLADEAHAEFVLAEHEAGHFGLRGLLGDRKPAALRSIFNQNPAVRRKVAALMEQDPSLSTLEAIEEVLVDTPTEELAKLRGWRALVGRVTQWLAERGFDKLAERLSQWMRGTLSEQQRADLFVGELVRAARDYAAGPPGSSEPLSATSRAMFSRREREGETIDGKPVPVQPDDPNPWNRLKARVMRLTDPKAIDRLIYEFQDKFVDLKRLQKHITELGGTVNDLNDAYVGEELFHKRLAWRTERFLEDELRPLLAEMRRREIAMEDFERYLHARHAPEANAALAERNPSTSKLQTLREDARRQVKALEEKLVHARQRQTATKALEEALQIARAEAQRLAMAQPFTGPESERRALSGMSNDEAAQLIAAMPPETRQSMEALAARVDAINEGTLKALQDYGLMSRDTLDAWRAQYRHYVPLHRDEAHAESAVHPIGSGFSVKGNASRSRVGSTAKVTHILGHIAMQRETALTRGEKNLVGKMLYLFARQNPDPQWWSTMTLPMTKMLDPVSGFVRVGVDPRYKTLPNVVMVRIAGRDVAITFNEHNPRALRLAEAMKNLDVGDLHVVLGLVAKGTRWFAALATQYSPVWGLVNFARDVQAGLLNLSTTAIAGQERKVAAGVLPAMRAIYRDARAKTPQDAEWTRLWREMQEAGGTTGYRDLFTDATDRAKALQRELESLDRGQVSQAAHAIVDWLSDYNETMENAVRLSAYRAALESGQSKVRAASLAKTITVNFNRKGRQARELGALFAFFNASVQGTARMASTLRGPLGKRIMYGGVALGAINALLGMAVMGGGEDDPWEQIPDFVKERSLIIPLGREDYVSLPMPLGFHVLPNIGRTAVEMAFGPQDKSAARRLGSLLATFLDAFNPLGGAQDIGQMVAPTVIDPVVALMENKDWTGRPIYRENPNALDPQPGHAMAKDSASTPARGLAKAINAVTGGTEFRPGAWSPTPDQIDYVVGQLTGGLGRELLKVNQTVAAQFTGDELPAHKVPLLGRLYGNTRGTAGQSSRFYENVKTLNELENEIKGRQRVGRDTEEVFRSEPLAELIGAGNAAEVRVRELRKERRAAAELAEPGYRDRLRELDATIAEAMRDLNVQVAEIRRAAAAPR